jgi:hypothetical protein
MKVLTIKSIGNLDTELQTEVHHTFGMEHYTDYVLKPRGHQKYSATIVIDNTEPVVEKVILESKKFPELAFVIDDLDLEKNSVERYHVKDGLVKEQLPSSWN